MTLSKEWIDSAISITTGFEVQGDPYAGVSGDFDKMGISCGALQFNIGTNTLQPLVKAVGKAVVTKNMPTYGNEMWLAATSSVKVGLGIVRGWQSGSTLKKQARAELVALMTSPEMRDQQFKAISVVADDAFALAKQWAGSRKAPVAASKRLFLWFFDLVTQNGSLSGVTYKDVENFIQHNTPDKADDVVCDFLAAQTGSSGHTKDANANGLWWRNKANDEKLELLVLSYLRSGKSNPLWRSVVLNRKGSIAMGSGNVNGHLYDFSKYGI